MVSPASEWYKGCGCDSHWCCVMIMNILRLFLIFWSKHNICMTQKIYMENWIEICLGQEDVRATRESNWEYSGSETNVNTTILYSWRSSHECRLWTSVIYHLNNVLSIKTILLDILDFWCQLEVIWFVKTLWKRRMFVSFMKISACWLLHRLIKFIKICWEKRPAKPRPNLRTSFCRRDL